MSEQLYSIDDVQRIAKFVMSQSYHEHYDDNSDCTPNYTCSLCGANLLQKYVNGRYVAPDLAKFKHKLDCLYLVGQDLLTTTKPE